jgi:hypothetical protein
MDYRNDHLLKILDAQPREDTLAIAAATEVRRLLGILRSRDEDLAASIRDVTALRQQANKCAEATAEVARLLAVLKVRDHDEARLRATLARLRAGVPDGVTADEWEIIREIRRVAPQYETLSAWDAVESAP